eukprot:1940962-Prymnesium_polylepis.1
MPTLGPKANVSLLYGQARGSGQRTRTGAPPGRSLAVSALNEKAASSAALPLRLPMMRMPSRWWSSGGYTVFISGWLLRRKRMPCSRVVLE